MAATAEILTELEPRRSARQEVRDFVAHVVDDSDDFSVRELVEETQRRFAYDPEFKEALFEEALAMKLELDALMHERRRPNWDSSVTQEKVELRAKELAARIYEATEDGRRKSLLAMRRPELLFAADAREKQAEGMIRFARLERELAAKMRTSDVTVRDAFTAAQFERIWRKHLTTAEGD